MNPRERISTLRGSDGADEADQVFFIIPAARAIPLYS